MMKWNLNFVVLNDLLGDVQSKHVDKMDALTASVQRGTAEKRDLSHNVKSNQAKL